MLPEHNHEIGKDIAPKDNGKRHNRDSSQLLSSELMQDHSFMLLIRNHTTLQITAAKGRHGITVKDKIFHCDKL